MNFIETDKIDENNLAQLTDFVYGAKPLIKPKIATNQVRIIFWNLNFPK